MGTLSTSRTYRYGASPAGLIMYMYINSLNYACLTSVHAALCLNWQCLATVVTHTHSSTIKMIQRLCWKVIKQVMWDE